MNKIGIDARLYSQTGVGVYLQNLLYNLDKKKDKNRYYVFLMEADFNRVVFKNPNIIKVKSDYPWHSWSEQTAFALQLYRYNLDLMHFTYFSYPVIYLKKFVATVHDATPLLFKTGKASTRNRLIYEIKHLFFRIIMKSQMLRSDTVITPTLSVKKQLESIYGSKFAGKIIPVYEGVNHKLTEAGENKNLNGRYKDFFIYVGNFYPHKNVESLISAFSEIMTESKLILIGPDDYFTSRILRFIAESGMNKRVILVKNPAISDLVFFYKNARALIHPSKSEGFGLPVIEASYFGCPVIASDIAVFKELLKNNYTAFNPADVSDIKRKIEMFINKKPARINPKFTEKYSFSEMTRKISGIYEDAISKA